jgi:hypothetical protein
VTVHEHEALMQAAKQFQRTERFRQAYRLRSTVEHRIARLVQLGLRKARFFGKAKLVFQLAMTAAVANLTLITSHVSRSFSFVSLSLQYVVAFLFMRAQDAKIKSLFTPVMDPLHPSLATATVAIDIETRPFRLCL